jgi:ABC-type transport system substrate-binding protein
VSNPILTALKVAAFSILALLVGFTFFQNTRREDSAEELRKQVGLLRDEISQQATHNRTFRDSVNRLSGAVEALTEVVSRQPRVVAGPGTPPTPEPEARPVGGGADAPPAHVKGRARELWGRRKNFLEPDPEEIVYPAFDSPDVDPNGRLRVWYGPQPSGINAFTKSDARLTIRVRTYCLGWIAPPHVKNPDKYRPDLAIRVEVDPEYKEWVVWLRPDALWHKPQLDLSKYPHLAGEHRVTAHDVKFSLDTILDKDVDAGWLRSYYTECEGIEVVDDTCYVMRWRKPQYNSIEYSLGSFFVLPEFVFAFDEKGRRYEPSEIGLKINDHWFYRANQWIGCGPYYVAEYVPGSHWLMRRFEDYYGPKPPIRELYQEIFPDTSVDVRKMESGEFDANQLNPKDWQKKVVEEKGPYSDGSMEEHWIWSTSFSFIAWKNTHPFFKDVRTRTAMTHATNRRRMLDVIHLGKGVVTTGPQFVASPFCPKDLEPLPFDLEKAKSILEEVGWKDRDGDGVLEKDFDGERKDFRIKAMVPKTEEFRAVFEILKEDLAKIGVRMELDVLEWSQFSERLDSRDFDVTALLWAVSGWEMDLYQIFHSSQIKEVPSSNFIAFSDPEVDRIIEELRGTFDPKKRIELSQKVHRRLAELQPYTFLFTVKIAFMSRKSRVGNVEPATRYVQRPVVRFFPMTIHPTR